MHVNWTHALSAAPACTAAGDKPGGEHEIMRPCKVRFKLKAQRTAIVAWLPKHYAWSVSGRCRSRCWRWWTRAAHAGHTAGHARHQAAHNTTYQAVAVVVDLCAASLSGLWPSVAADGHVHRVGVGSDGLVADGEAGGRMSKHLVGSIKGAQPQGVLWQHRACAPGEGRAGSNLD